MYNIITPAKTQLCLPFYKFYEKSDMFQGRIQKQIWQGSHFQPLTVMNIYMVIFGF